MELLEMLKRKFMLHDPQKREQFLDAFYVRKYGSYEKAQQVLLDLKEQASSEEAFYELIHEKIKEDFHLRDLLRLLSSLRSVRSMTQLVNHLFKLKKDPSYRHHRMKNPDLVTDYHTLMKPAFEEVYTHLYPNQKEDVIQTVNDSIKFTLAQTRKELDYPDQRTFNWWLQVFFGDTYLHRGDTNGYISLHEYLEIVTTFLTSESENTFDFSQIEELKHRFDNEKFTQKKMLIAYTKNNYKLLNERLDDLADDKSYLYQKRKPEDKEAVSPFSGRKLPYRIVQLLKEDLAKRPFQN